MASVTLTVEYHNGTAWTDITSDVVSAAGVSWTMGLQNASVTDRVAPPGTVELEMNNSISNSAGLNGYYSPDHANVRTGWVIGARLRIKLVSSPNTRYWLYRIKDIIPAAGERGQRRVRVTGVDYMDEFLIRKINALTVQFAKRSDELLTTLVATMPIAPTTTSYDRGTYIFPYAFHDEQSENTFAITVLQKIAQSGMDYIYVDGDATGGETLYLESATARYHNTTSAATIDTPARALNPVHSRDSVVNKVRVTVYPVEVDNEYIVLAHTESDIVLEPGETNKKITLRYLDPGNDRRITGYDIQSLVENTDYSMSRRPNVRNGGLNSDLTISMSAGADSVELTLSNANTTRKGYVWAQVRGKSITLWNKVEVIAEDAVSQDTYGERTISFVMPYQTDPGVAQIAANEIIRRYKNPQTQIQSVEFNANRSATYMGYALTLGIGDRITVTESITGISDDYFINGVSYTLSSGNILNVTYVLERAFGESGMTYFKLGTSTFADGHILIPL